MSRAAADPKTATGTATVTVTEVNDAPVAGADSKTTAEDTQLVFAASTLTANDSPEIGSASCREIVEIRVSAPTIKRSTVSLAGGNLTYSSAANFTATDTLK